MISVMNNKDYYELDTKSNQIEDNEAKSSRVLNDIAVNGEENFVNSGVSNEARVSPMELDAVAAQSMREAGDFRNERSDDAHGVRDCTDSDDMDVDSRVFEVNSDSASDDRLESKNGKFEPKGDRIVSEVDSDVDLLSEFDDYVANEKHGAMLGTSRALSFGFEVGDMVWGKVKSHPWWPGHIFNEAFATSSVRRTRREGYVLVAFFGDSSYGWFDPAELIPFDRYFTEKSQQTTSRTFVKAVEEAMDEASRRRSLGLACKCRNPYNFRPTNIEGYFAVDVPDYEPNGVYSADQIKKARDRFKPGETLSFVKQLAVAPQGSEQKSFEFMENKATVFTFRKAAFEEYDETYAQAFAVQTARPAQDPVRQKEQPVKAPTRAPLSGPLVIAEALGGGKVAKKPMKVKDYSKKDKYLFKRRDEPSEINQGQPSSLAPSEYMEGSTAAEAGEYVLQKRALALHIPVKSEQPGFVTGDVAGPSVNVSCNLAFQGAAADTKLSLDMLETKERTGSDIPGVVDSTSISLQQEDNDMIDIKHEGGRGLDRVQDGHSVGHPKLVGLKRSIGMTAEGGVKKVKVLKRPSGDLSSESSNMVEKKKKRKKKELSSETNSDSLRKRMAPQKGETGMGNLKGKSSPLSLAPREESRVNQQKKDAGSTNSLFSSAMTLQLELELPQILGDLHALALDPFHGLERNSPAIIRQFFLRFRSIVYQKSLVLSPPSETEPVEVRATKTTSSFPSENARDSIPSKPGKPLLRPDDPTKAGRKAMPSDRQEEIAAKRLKRINQIKSLAAEKKASQKTLEAPRVEVKEQVASGPSKPVKSDSVKKTVLQARAVQPTMLVMKFPPDTSLPSGPELKAKFGRFGSLDQSAIRVFWKTSTCRVVFRHKVDAEAAYNYAVGNKSLFGNVRVRYSVREAGAPASETPECDKGRGDDFSMETLQFKDTVVERAALAPARSHQPSLQPAVQLKSCLKKPTGEEAGQATGGNGGRGTPRVKFILGGEEITNRGEALMVGNRNNFDNNNASFADGGAPSSSSSSVAMDYNSKNFQKVIPTSTTILPLPLPLQFAKTPLTLPPQFAKTPLNNAHHTEVAPSLPPPPPPPPPRNSHNNLNTASTPSSIDISQQMLSLLTRCNDVVTNVTGLLGYVPYHPL